MRAVGYARVSTDEQAKDGLSLDVQEEKIRAYCLAKDWKLMDMVRDEKSAKDLNRPGIQQVLAGVESRKWEVLVICKLDRLTRSVRDLGYLVQDVFERHGVAFYSIADNFDTTTANGKLVLNILGSVAQWERDIISERTRDALAHKRLDRGELVGALPLGFDLADDGKTLVPNQEEMAVVDQILKLRDKCWSYRRIASQLNNLGAPTKRGGKWRPWTIQYISQNPIYQTAAV